MISIFKNWGDDVVAIINGQVITKADLLDDKRKRQRNLLQRKLASGNVWKPCFIWVFCNESWLWNGWYLYISTLRYQWQIGTRGHYSGLIPKIMGLYPCGYEPIEENRQAWMPAFAAAHHRPTAKRPRNNGLAIARALISPGGKLLDVAPWEAVREEESV